MGLLTATSNKVVPLPPAKYWCRGCSTSFLNWSSCLQHVRSNPHPHDPQLYFLSTTKPGRRQLQELCKLSSKAKKPRKSQAPTKVKKVKVRPSGAKVRQASSPKSYTQHQNQQKCQKVQSWKKQGYPRKQKPRIQPFDSHFDFPPGFSQFNAWQNRASDIGSIRNIGSEELEENFPPLSPQSTFSCESTISTDSSYSTASDCSSTTCESATESCSLSNRFADLGGFDVPHKIEKSTMNPPVSTMSNPGLSILNALPIKPAYCVVQFLEDADCDNLLQAY